MKTVDIKTSQLSGVALDWAVAKSEGLKTMLWPQVVTVLYPDAPRFVPFKPSTNWAQGGPIIETNRLCIGYKHEVDSWLIPPCNPDVECWARDTAGGYLKYGPTPLIAAMRCYVASKLGDTVSIPAELVS